jgi:hypothetical protein
MKVKVFQLLYSQGVAPRICCIGERVDPRASLDPVEKTKIPASPVSLLSHL